MPSSNLHDFNGCVESMSTVIPLQNILTFVLTHCASEFKGDERNVLIVNIHYNFIINFMQWNLRI